jgi:hypothetical protein
MPRLSFTLRDVFWLTLVVGILCVWGIDHSWAAARYRKLSDAVWASRCKTEIFGSFGEVLPPIRP